MITPDIARFMYLIKMFKDIDPETEIKPWSKATPKDPYEMMYYDDSKPQDEKSHDAMYPIVMDKCLDELHHDIISTWDHFVEGDIEVRFCIDTEDNHKFFMITVNPIEGMDEPVDIYIEDGDWDLW